MAATAFAPLGGVDPWVHWIAIRHFRFAAMCSLHMAQLHLRQVYLQLQLQHQNSYILHRRGRAALLASQAQAAMRDGHDAPHAPTATPSPTADVADDSAENGVERSLAPKKETSPQQQFVQTQVQSRFLPARCPAVVWTASDEDAPDVVPFSPQPSDKEGYEGDEETDDTHHFHYSDNDHDTKTQDWPDSNSDPDQPWHPKGPYDPAYDVDSPEWDCGLWTAARTKEELEEGIPTPPEPQPHNWKNDIRINPRPKNYAYPAEPFDFTEDPGEARRRQRLRSAYEKIQDRRLAPDVHQHRELSEDFYWEWAEARVHANGTDYREDHSDSHFHPDYNTEFDSDCLSPSLTDQEFDVNIY
jgi:hypothetical protein